MDKVLSSWTWTGRGGSCFHLEKGLSEKGLRRETWNTGCTLRHMTWSIFTQTESQLQVLNRLGSHIPGGEGSGGGDM